MSEDEPTIDDLVDVIAPVLAAEDMGSWRADALAEKIAHRVRAALRPVPSPERAASDHRNPPAGLTLADWAAWLSEAWTDDAKDAMRAALSAVPEGAASEAIGQLAADGHVSLAMRLDAAVPSPEPLDVERLADSILRCIEAEPTRKAWEDESIQYQAEAIATEYARLAAPQPVQEDAP